MHLLRYQGLLQLHSSKFAFSSAAAEQIASRNYTRFQKKYHEYVNAFNDKLQQIEKDQKVQHKPPTDRAYVHPFQTKENPINFSAIKTGELFHEAIGPEQVSPHYENFLVARKYLIGTYVGIFALTFAAGTTDLNWIAKSSVLPFIFWMQIMYFYLEGRKSVFKPNLVRFYRRVAQNEIFQMETFYHENMELRVRQLLQLAKNQIEFSNLHRDYRDVKAELINTFLYNEQINLQKHVTNRALNILRQTETYENLNQQRLLQEVVDKAQAQLERSLVENQAEIRKQMFRSALEGLSRGRMDYANDPILPLVIKSIQDNVARIKNLTPQEQVKLVSLTADQLQSIKDADKRAKQEYLTAEPKIDSSLKQYEQVRRQISTWGQ